MKIISVGDSAGKRCWEDIDPKKYDYIVLLGDLVDPRDGISSWQVIDNLKKLIEFKKANMEKVILILGNHDLGYLYWNNRRFECNPHDSTIGTELHRIYGDNVHLFQIAFQVKTHLYTHAGVTKGWYDRVVKEFHKKRKDRPLADTINTLWKVDKYNISHVGWERGGRDPFGGPAWAHGTELTADAILPGYHQVVGHNRVKDFVTVKKSARTSITFTDVLDHQIKFHEVKIRTSGKDKANETVPDSKRGYNVSREGTYNTLDKG